MNIYSQNAGGLIGLTHDVGKREQANRDIQTMVKLYQLQKEDEKRELEAKKILLNYHYGMKDEIRKYRQDLTNDEYYSLIKYEIELWSDIKERINIYGSYLKCLNSDLEYLNSKRDYLLTLLNDYRYNEDEAKIYSPSQTSTRVLSSDENEVVPIKGAYYAWIEYSSVIYNEPNVFSYKIKKVGKGTMLQFVDESGSFYKIKYNSTTGYINKIGVKIYKYIGDKEKTYTYLPNITNNHKQSTHVEKENIINNKDDFSFKIRQLIIAEDKRDFDLIYSFYSPNMKKYWFMNNPSYNSLKTQYEKIWSITSDSKNKIKEIVKLGDNIYYLYNDFSYYHIKKGKYLKVSSTVRFVFDKNGKIIEVEGID